MKDLQRDLKAFSNRYSKELGFVCAVLSLALFHFLFTGNYRMDTIIKLVFPGDEFNDLELGRFGIIYLNRLLGMRFYNHYLVAFLTLVLIVLCSGLFSFMVWKATDGACGRLACYLPLWVFLTPNWMEQLFFSYQSFLVMLGVLLLEAAVYMAEYGEGRRWVPLSAALVFVAFSVYQAFVPLHVCLCVAVVLLRCACVDRISALRLDRSILRHIAAFLIALAGYFVVDRIIQSRITGTTYLTSQIRWGMEPIPGVILNVLQSLRSVLLAQGKLDTLAYILSMGVSLILVVVRIARKREDRALNVALALGWLGLQLTSFAMLLALGARSYIRAELSITVVVAVNFMLALILARKWAEEFRHPRLRPLPTAAVLLAALLALYMNTDVTFRLIYTDDMRYVYDYSLANRVIDRLDRTSAREGNKTVVFYGEPEVRLNASCIDGEVIGRSLFAFHMDLEGTNNIIHYLMISQGMDYAFVDHQAAIKAHEAAADMPDWPAQGSVKETDDVIVVKFSDCPYFEAELLTPGHELAPDDVALSTETVCRLDSMGTDGENLIIRGFNIKRGVDSRNIKNEVYLRNVAEDELFRINTACEQRLLVSEQYNVDNTNYNASGFVAMCSMDVIEDEPDAIFEVLVRYTLDGEAKFVSTGSFISKRVTDRMVRQQTLQNAPLEETAKEDIAKQ